MDNYLIRQCGTEGRRMLAARLSEHDLIIANYHKAKYYEGTKATMCNTTSMHDLPTGDYVRVVVDLNVPGAESRRFATLERLCEGRIVIFPALVYAHDVGPLHRLIRGPLREIGIEAIDRCVS